MRSPNLNILLFVIFDSNRFPDHATIASGLLPKLNERRDNHSLNGMEKRRKNGRGEHRWTKERKPG